MVARPQPTTSRRCCRSTNVHMCRSSLSPCSSTPSEVCLLFSLPRTKHALLCSSTALRLCSTSSRAAPPTGRRRLASVSRHPGPPPSCGQDPPQGRSRPRAVSRREAKVADVEFFIHRERLSGAGLLRWFLGPAEPSTSFTSPTRRSTTSPTPTSTLPLASHQRPPPPKKRRRRLLPSVSLSPPHTSNQDLLLLG
jgi:hypothetical protein